MRIFYTYIIYIIIIIVVVEPAYSQTEDTTSFFDLIKSIDEEDTLSLDSIPNNEKIQVESIIFITGGEIIINPVPKKISKSKIDISTVMQYISFRRGDIMSVGRLKQKIRFSSIRISLSPFFYSDNTYDIVVEKQDDGGPRIAKVYFIFERSFGYAFGGGYLYGYFGIRTPKYKIIFDSYAGVNRQELVFQSLAHIPRSKKTDFARIGFSIYSRFLAYWIFPSLDLIKGGLLAQTYLYGIEVLPGINLHPTLKYSFGVGIFGHSGIKKVKSEQEIIDAGMPLPQTTSSSIDFRNILDYEVTFKEGGFFRDYIEIKIPYIIGYARKTSYEKYTLFDMIGADFQAQVSFFWGIQHAFSFKGAFASPVMQAFVPGYRPHIAKVNVRRGFYFKEGMLIDLISRGSLGRFSKYRRLWVFYES